MRSCLAILALITLAAPAFAVDPQLLRLVMPNPKLLLGMNVASARLSPLGEFLAGRLSLNNEPWRSIVAAGFDPAQDISELLLASEVTAASTPSTDLLLLSGDFDVDKITAAAGKNKLEVGAYHSHTLLRFTEPQSKLPSAVAFVNSSLAVSGVLPAVQAAIDRSSGAASVPQTLSSEADRLSANQDLWFIGDGSLLASIMGSNSGDSTQFAKSFNSIRLITLGAKFGTDVQITGRATGEPDSILIMAMTLKMISSVGNAKTGPGSMFPNMTQAQLDGLRLLQGLQVTSSGGDLLLSLTIPEAEAEKYVRESTAKSPATPAKTK